MSTTPQSDPQAMPLDQLRQAAGLNGDPTPAPESTPAAPPAPVVPEAYTVAQDDNGVTITLAPEFGGEVYKGKDFNEVVTKLAKAKADANGYIKQLKTQPATPATPAPAAPAVDPAVQATRDWLLSEQAAALGMSVDEYKTRVQMVFQTTETMQTNIALADFHKMCPGYVDTPDNSRILAEYIGEIDHFPTAKELKSAYALAVIDGKISPQTTAPAAVSRPAPMLTGTSGPTSGTADAWKMDMNDLKKAAGLA